MEIKPTKTFQARGGEAARAGGTFLGSETIVTDLQLINSYTGVAKTLPIRRFLTGTGIDLTTIIGEAGEHTTFRL